MNDEAQALPFEGSRRLTGPNLFFAGPGALLDAFGADDGLLQAWRQRVLRGVAELGWPAPAGTPRGVVARTHAKATSLAIAAPPDQLLTATELNEWAWCASLHERDPGRWATLEADWLAATLEDSSDPESVLAPVLEERAAFERLATCAARERNPALLALLQVADRSGLPAMADDDSLTLGRGAGGRSWPLAALPEPQAVDWQTLHGIPTALVTGSNGKTTTVRVVAACARAQGWRTGYSCTDGLVVGEEEIKAGDYSGPLGARTVLRDVRVEAAVLETARGGILRRGLAVAGVQAAVVTNVSADHFGEYGVDDLAALADVKLTVGGVLRPDGLLVLNADDPLLVSKAAGLAARFGRCPPLGWFAADFASARAAGGVACCGQREGELWLEWHGIEHRLGAVRDMPLSAGGLATYNLANLAAASLVAAALGVEPARIAATLARFGAAPRDNSGRLMRYRLRGMEVWLDYAHNPDGIRGVLETARRCASGGRIATLLGHAGNRLDADFDAVAATVAAAHPDLVIVKEDEGHLRGRAPGEVSTLLHAALLRHGMGAGQVESRDNEIAAAERVLAWGRPGDVLVLTVHGRRAREALLTRLELEQRLSDARS